MNSDNIPICENTVQFLQQIWAQNGVVREHWRFRGGDLVRDSSREKQWAIVRELLTRARRQGPAAMMSSFERMAVHSYAEFLVQQFHNLQGTPEDKRPRVSFVPGGGTMWVTEGSNQQ